MSERVTLTLRDDVFQRAEQVSRNTGRPVAQVLADAIDATFDPLGPSKKIRTSLSKLSDDELLEVVDSRMTRTDAKRLSQLLERQREEQLTPAERTELMALHQVYQEGLVRKARAISEASRRGLRGPRKS